MAIRPSSAVDARGAASERPLLSVRNLRVRLDSRGRRAWPVDGVDLEIRPGETLGLVGESGSGKSLTSYAIMRLLTAPLSIERGGEVSFEGVDLVSAPERRMRQIRGNEISIIFQEPALNPAHRIGKQIEECVLLHEKVSPEELHERCVELMELVGISAPEQRLRLYPHQLSGGMRQRVCIAMALACRPKMLIADEPTTALDVTIQAQILELLRDLSERLRLSVLFISHDLGVIAQICDRVAVMYAGRVIESGTVEEIFEDPLHPYAKGLLASMPTMGMRKDRPLASIPGMVRSSFEWGTGCRFVDRCPVSRPECHDLYPPSEEIEGHEVRCWVAMDEIVDRRGGGASDE